MSDKIDALFFSCQSLRRKMSKEFQFHYYLDSNILRK